MFKYIVILVLFVFCWVRFIPLRLVIKNPAATVF